MALAFSVATAGCEFISTVDRSTLGKAAGGGGADSPTAMGSGGFFLGAGGSSGSAGSTSEGGSGTTDGDGSTIGSGGAAGAMLGAGGSMPATGSGGSAGSFGTGGSAGNPVVDSGSDSSSSTCVRALPAGWTVAVFSPTATSCPGGYVDHPVYSGSGTPGAAACTCGCTVSQPGTCQGTVSVSIAPGQGVDTCTVTLVSSAAVSGSSCIQASTLRAEAAAAIFTGGGQGGSCADTTSTNASQLGKPAPQHYCDVPASNSDAVCNGIAPAGFSACIARAGNVACPAPFTRISYPVEDDIALNCSACTGCSVTMSCAAGTVNLFSDGNCATPVGSVPANNSCVILNASNEVPVGSLSYAAAATPSCSPGASVPSTTPVGPRTICCR